MNHELEIVKLIQTLPLGVYTPRRHTHVTERGVSLNIEKEIAPHHILPRKPNGRSQAGLGQHEK